MHIVRWGFNGQVLNEMELYKKKCIHDARHRGRSGIRGIGGQVNVIK